MNFNGGFNESCFVDENGDNTVNAITIDKFFRYEAASPTFIKLDIEGSEMKALYGAADIIMKSKPKLAVCLYHNPEDIWKIPLYIKKLVPEYRLYIRNYRDDMLDIVCYATL